MVQEMCSMQQYIYQKSIVVLVKILRTEFHKSEFHWNSRFYLQPKLRGKIIICPHLPSSSNLFLAQNHMFNGFLRVVFPSEQRWRLEAEVRIWMGQVIKEKCNRIGRSPFQTGRQEVKVLKCRRFQLLYPKWRVNLKILKRANVGQLAKVVMNTKYQLCSHHHHHTRYGKEDALSAERTWTQETQAKIIKTMCYSGLIKLVSFPLHFQDLGNDYGNVSINRNKKLFHKSQVNTFIWTEKTVFLCDHNLEGTLIMLNPVLKGKFIQCCSYIQ